METESRQKRRLTKDETILASGVVLVFILLGIANVLFLPPYEGFDETAHYSYISFLSDQHQIPNFLRTSLDATMEDGRRGLPRLYSSLPPFEINGGITYGDFFGAETNREREDAVKRFWREPQKIATYTPGQDINWQGQHPPLYYFFMSFPYRQTRTWPPGMRLLLLRLCSVALACGSLLFWCRTIALLQTSDSRQFFLLGGLTAVFFPSLFYDFARLGNDSLVALLFAGSFYFLFTTYVHKQERIRDFFGLAFILGLGLLTKLFFLPLLLGIGLCSLLLGLRYTKIGVPALLFRMSLLVSVPLLLAGWWFYLFWLHYGMWIGSSELYAFQPTLSPVRSDLSSAQFLLQMLRAGGGFATTFLWCGTWSWVRPPLYLYVCFAPFAALTAYGLATFWIHEPIHAERRWLVNVAMIVLLPVLLGFIYHMSLRVKFTGIGFGTGGYYLFFAWPVIGLLGAGSFMATQTSLLKVSTLVAFVALSFFDAAGWWRSALVYSGLLQKVGAVQTGVGFLSPTVDNIAFVLDRLRMLAFPRAAVILYGMAFLLRSALVTWAIFFLPPLSRSFRR